VGYEVSHVDRQTDIMKLIVTCHNYANVPENQLINVILGTMNIVLTVVQNPLLLKFYGITYLSL